MLFSQITPRGILSFGPETEPIELGKLNVLIGPNGSGKSNLIDVISLFEATTGDLAKPIRETGGIRNWVWKNHWDGISTVNAVICSGDGEQIEHEIGFGDDEGKFALHFETVQKLQPNPQLLYSFNKDKPWGKLWNQERTIWVRKKFAKSNSSVFSRLQDSDSYPEISWLTEQYGMMFYYRDWRFGRNAPVRMPKSTDEINDFLFEDFSNLALVLNRLWEDLSLQSQVLEQFKKLNPLIDDIGFSVKGGTIQVYLEERGRTIPSSRISDGTLQYLCLLSILCDPDPPPLVCIEEPEIGLHPDILPCIAELLINASERTQLIVTTHSDVLVSALSDVPEGVVVCEATEEGTSMRRLDPDKLSHWLKDYSLGDLWTSGELGGNRW